MKYLVLTVSVLFTIQASALNPKRIFKKKCMSCHSFSSEEAEKGPSLADIAKRRTVNWLVKYIKNPDSLREQQDSIALDLKSKYKESSMPSFERYNEEGLKQLVAYISAKGAGTDSNINSGIGDINAGRYLSTNCTNCHGNLGITNDLKIPNIAGQNVIYLINQMKAYKSGQREDPKGNMNDISQSLSLRDIVNLATYFSSLNGS